MSWITIDEDKCTVCGDCVQECLNGCLTDEGGIIVTNAGESNCILCGHCVAVCSESAITHHRLNMECFAEYKETRPNPDDFFQFLKERRSHRHYLDKLVPRQDLEKLVDICRHVPTGSNSQSVEIIMVQDAQEIEKLSDMTVDYLEALIQKIMDKSERLKAEGLKPSPNLQFSLDRVDGFKRPIQAKKEGRDPVFFKAPAVMIFHSVDPTSAPKDNCVIAAQTVTLAARTLGLESCYIGMFEIAANYWNPIKQTISLPEDHKVFSVLVLGYPKFKYKRTVDRNPISIRWGLSG